MRKKEGEDVITQDHLSQCRKQNRHRFYPWVRKTPWRRVWQPTLVFLLGESPWTEEPGRLLSMGCKESGRT